MPNTSKKLCPIDITMTAVIRPSILAESLQTIVDNVVDDIDRFRLIINVDPIGEKSNPEKVIKIARKFFPNTIGRVAPYPSFPKAVKWVWSKVEASYVLHWEDDVDILRKIDINRMIKILENHEYLSSLRLFKHKTPKDRTSMFVFSCRWVYNKEGFYIAKDWKKQFGLNPILIKREFIESAVSRMRDDVNPEKQFRYSQKYMRSLIQKWKYGIYAKPGELRIVDGRKGQRWKNRMKLQKPKGKTFLEWVKNKEET